MRTSLGLPGAFAETKSPLNSAVPRPRTQKAGSQDISCLEDAGESSLHERMNMVDCGNVEKRYRRHSPEPIREGGVEKLYVGEERQF